MAENHVSAQSAAPAPTIDNVGHAVLETVRNYGVDTVFGIPGTHNLEFYRHVDALKLRAVTTRHEQGAGYGAAGWALRTGLPGVVVTTSGPGLLNVLSAAATSFCESRPMLILAPGAPGGEFADVGALHETKDQLSAAEAVVGSATRVYSGAQAVEAVHAAFASFAGPRPRPVYIEVPLDVLEAAADVPADARAARPMTTAPAGESAIAASANAAPATTAPTTTAADPSDVARAAGLLATARNPVIVAGSGALPARDALLKLAERLDAPVISSVNARGVIPESHPLALGAAFRFATSNELVNAADIVLIVGSKLGQAELWSGPLAPTGTVIRIDALASRLTTNVHPDLGLVARAQDALPALLTALPTPATERVEPAVEGTAASPANGAANAPKRDESGAARVARAREAFTAEAVSGDYASVALARTLAPVLPAGTIVGADSSQACYNGTANFIPVDEPNSYVYMPTYATLGFGLPASIGAAIANPDRPVVCVLGDGALMFSVQEFTTAIEQGVDNLVVVVADNGGYREIEANEAAVGIPPTAVRLTQPDWAALATALGAHGVSIGSAEEAARDVAQAIDAGGVHLVHVPMEIFEKERDD